MQKTILPWMLVASFSATGCTIVPSGEECTRTNFPSYFKCYRSIHSQKSQAYEELIAYGQILSTDVRNGVLANESAFRLFSQRRQSVQDQLVEAQAFALSNAMRRSSSDK